MKTIFSISGSAITDIPSFYEEINRCIGPTFFDIVLDIIADHPNIELQPG